MIVLALTGSLGMGKSTAAAMLRRMQVPVWDADAEVHRLLGPGGDAVAEVAREFPGALLGDRIDRKRLGARVFGDAVALRRLEAILHPKVRAAERRFLQGCRRRRAPIVVLDIPLLFETGGEKRVDGVIVVSAPAWLQRQRVLRRPGMSADRLRAVLAQQVPDAQKRRRADWVIPTGLGKAATRRRLREVLRAALAAGHRISASACKRG
ncbi:MAG TPA: dephospho-CoA kinase [Stellaceae bacterium]|nr:dephospho-CoA kinase [Stellaceae bacterium]